MEFTLGLFTGMLLWPWWGLGIFALLCLVDVVLVENENASFGTAMMLIGTGVLVWLAGETNPFTLAWDNIGDIIKFFVGYFVVGAVWSIAKWYLYLLKVRDNMSGSTKKRPDESYACNNYDRIGGWIGHWPFSMIGSLFGDFLSRVVKTVIRVLSNLYESLGNVVFKEFEK